MSTVHSLPSLDKEYPCVQCGSTAISVIRKDDVNPRLKCNSCNFMFNGQDSESAQKAGSIPEASIETLKDAVEPDQTEIQERGSLEPTRPHSMMSNHPHGKIPRTIKYVLVSKDRKRYEFCNDKSLKRTALRWESDEIRYDLYELLEKKSEVKISIE